MPNDDLLQYVDAADIQALRGADLAPRGSVDGRGVGRYRSTQQGSAVEFASHREYAQGDDIRHFDWRVFHRTGRKTTRLYYQDTDFTVRMVLDTRPSMTFPSSMGDSWRRRASGHEHGAESTSKLAYAAAIALLIALTVTRRRDRFALHLPANDQSDLPPSSSPGQVANCLKVFDALEPAKDGDSPLDLSRLGQRFGRRELIILLTDANELPTVELENALRYWRAAKHEVILVHLLHTMEVDFPFDDYTAFHAIGGPLGSSPSRLEADAREIRGRYLQHLAAFRDRMRGVCHGTSATYWPLITRFGPGETLARFLRGRKSGIVSG